MEWKRCPKHNGSSIEEYNIIKTVTYKEELDLLKMRESSRMITRFILTIGGHLQCNDWKVTHGPVSYTHLDVYKRQRIGSELEWINKN